MAHSFKVPHTQALSTLITATKRPLSRFILPAIGILGVGMLAGAGLGVLFWPAKGATKNRWRESGQLGRKAMRRRQAETHDTTAQAPNASNGMDLHEDVASKDIAPKDVGPSDATPNSGSPSAASIQEIPPLKLAPNGQFST